MTGKHAQPADLPAQGDAVRTLEPVDRDAGTDRQQYNE